MKPLTQTFLGSVVIGFLIGASCNQSQVISTLTAAVASAEVALPVIAQAAGTPPATIEAITKYLHAVGVATAKASEILSGSGSAAQKSALIAQAFAAVASGCNCVPTGTPARVVAVVDAVARSVIAFLANFPSSDPSARTGPPVETSNSDKQELAKLKIRSDVIANATGTAKP